jgi:hypothetical protein
VTRLAALAVSALIIGCTTGHLSEKRDRPLTRTGENVAKGVGMVLYTPRLMTIGPQRIVVALSVGSPVKMANVSAVWLTYRPPSGAVQQTVRMLPVGDYLDAFGAVMPLTETGLYHVGIHVYRVGGVPATSTFRILCCDEADSTTNHK